MDTMRFQPLPPYNFALTMDASRFYAVLGRQHQGAYRRALRVGGTVALVEIVSEGTVESPLLAAHVLATAGSIDTDLLRLSLERLLNLHVDLRPFYAFVESDPVLWNTVQQTYGLRTFGSERMFEAVVLSIIEQQITLRQAHAAERWLAAWAGDSIEYEGAVYSTFPTPERIAAASVDDLKPLKITTQRMQRIIDIAQGEASGTLNLEALRTVSPQDAYLVLRSLKGVGHWTAAWTLIKGVGHFANFSSADVGLRAAVNAYYFGLPRNAAPEVVDALLTSYGDFDGMAAFYTLMRWALEKYTYL